MSITAIERALVKRLRDTLQASGLVAEVYGMDDYANVPENNMVTPSVAVIYNGYNPVNTRPAPGIQSVEYGWLVIANVASAAQGNGSSDAVRDEVSPIADAIIENLIGFRPVAKFDALTLEPAPGAAVSPGFGYFPFAFSIRGTYRATPQT